MKKPNFTPMDEIKACIAQINADISCILDTTEYLQHAKRRLDALIDSLDKQEPNIKSSASF